LLPYRSIAYRSLKGSQRLGIRKRGKAKARDKKKREGSYAKRS
jgi:hypothetical protein